MVKFMNWLVHVIIAFAIAFSLMMAIRDCGAKRVDVKGGCDGRGADV